MNINIHDADLAAILRQGRGQIDRDRAFAHAALAAHHKNLVLDAFERLGDYLVLLGKGIIAVAIAAACCGV